MPCIVDRRGSVVLNVDAIGGGRKGQGGAWEEERKEQRRSALRERGGEWTGEELQRWEANEEESGEQGHEKHSSCGPFIIHVSRCA